MMKNSIISWLEEAAAVCPDRTALEDTTDSYTYAQYRRNARRIASYLMTECGVKETGRPVVVYIDRNALSVFAFLGAVYTGNFYVPVDPTMPESRCEMILESLQPAAVLDAGGRMKAAGVTQVADILSDEPLSEEEEKRIDRRVEDIIDTDPLYSIFTSGSTGVPKGVLISHRGVLDLVAAFDEAFHFNEEDIFANQAPFDFDVSVKDLYNAMACRGCVYIVPKKYFMMPKQLVAVLSEKKITVLIWAVSAVRIVADFAVLNQEEHPLSLRYLMFSGEIMPVRALNYWRENLPETICVNLYGPTEITCNCTYHIIDRTYAPDAMLPIGRSFRNMRVTLRDEQGNVIAEPGKTGEICVAGTGLALGYYDMPEKTAESFADDPCVSGYKAKIYHTGDMGYYDEEGLLFFAARADSQIKHMGHRIELGEIEAALNGIPFLHVACCLYDQSAEKILCIYEAEEECKKEIVAALSKKLPKFMWPNRYIHMEKLPMNSHDKIDRQALKKEYLS
ncbi:MAG: amino acid adenylation domain-containing protein [Lachnospiraceae bacterium]|nr:amino acid adenylation domain-containing protein [Lachnospiraceae bacterium]